MDKTRATWPNRPKSGRVLHRCSCGACAQHPYGSLAKEHQAINRVLNGLDERNKRCFAGLLARQRGNILEVSHITGLSRNTIYRGQHEVEHPSENPLGGIRRAGGGRFLVEKKNLEL
jgi:hypothetical protein